MCEDRVNWLGNYLFSKQVSKLGQYKWSADGMLQWPVHASVLLCNSYESTYSEKVVSRTSATSGTFIEHSNECGALVQLKLQERA